MAALEALFGPSAEQVSHALVPFYFGYDAGGRADVIRFQNYVGGSVYVTCDLIGCDNQIKNSLGNYELAICHRGKEIWGIDIISNLAFYTLDELLEPGDTMDIGQAVPKNSSLRGLLFLDFGRFSVRDRHAGVLLCIGITADEIAVCRSGGRSTVEAELNAKGVYPYTDLQRKSVL